MEILAIIPARGGSKRIPRKNIKIFSGEPLLAFTAKAALNSARLSRVILTTDDEEIKKIGLDLGLEVPFVRPLKLAQDDTPSLPVFQHVVKTLEDRGEGYRPDVIVVLQPTSPLRTTKHIDEALNIFLEGDTDSLVSVTEVPHNMNPYSMMQLQKDGTITPFLNYDESKNLRQKKPVFYARNGAAIYICTYECLMEKNSLYGDTILPFFMKKEESFDLDDEVDWEIAEYFNE
jgi:CMP-N,N'-diacetyllegionaminic acid synthase